MEKSQKNLTHPRGSENIPAGVPAKGECGIIIHEKHKKHEKVFVYSVLFVEEKIMKMPKIYLDNCTYNRPFDDQSQMKIRLETESKLYIQSGIRKKKYSLVWSYVLDYENSNNPYEEKRNAISPWKEIADDYCPSSDDILALGIKIMKHGIKAKDALHIACAVKSGCDYFITTDNKLTNKTIANIRIVNPIDFILETESLP